MLDSVRAPRIAGCLLAVTLTPPALIAGGPKFVAGISYFNPAVNGQPVHWSGGQIRYYVDQGPLNSQVSNQQATAMVDAAAALWSAVPTAAVALVDAGQLNEDVYDDIAARNRIYPVTTANLGVYPGKQLTASNTVSIQGTITFCNGAGMQGVNVVARPLDANSNPLYQYTVTFVSGAYFSGNHGNPVTEFDDADDNLLTMWGSNNPALQGFFDLRFMPLPPGMTTASYQVTFEPINPLYMESESVGPYEDGSPSPSGTMPVLSVPFMAAGSSQSLTVNIADSAAGGFQDAIATAASPRNLAGSGQWLGRLSQVGQADWFVFPVRAGHSFTVVTQALDENGVPTETKALLALGVWDAFDPVGAPSVGWAPGLNGWATGESWLRVSTAFDDVVRLGIADMRGDGRPDYAYMGWVLYADTVSPARLPASGGPIVIQGMGFRPSDTVLVGGHPALVTSISPNEITAIAPPASQGVTGSVDIEVDDLPIFYAASIVSGGVSYDSGTGDSLTLDTAPQNTVPLGAPLPFTVTAFGSSMAPAAGVTVTYAVASGTATLGCGLPTCAVTATGDGLATMSVTAVNTSPAVVMASLTNGASVQAHFTGGAAPILTALTPTLSIAAGSTFTWSTQALVLNNGTPTSGQFVAWQPAAGIAVPGGTAAVSSSNGIASKTLTVGPLAEGQQSTSTACVNGTSNCANFTVLGARPEYAWLQAVSGTKALSPICALRHQKRGAQ